MRTAAEGILSASLTGTKGAGLLALRGPQHGQSPPVLIALSCAGDPSLGGRKESLGPGPRRRPQGLSGLPLRPSAPDVKGDSGNCPRSQDPGWTNPEGLLSLAFLKAFSWGTYPSAAVAALSLGRRKRGTKGGRGEGEAMTPTGQHEPRHPPDIAVPGPLLEKALKN